MRPNGQEVLRGVQNTLVTYILPELQSDYARTELMIVHTLVGIVAEEWDGVAQRLVDDNAALRELARRGVEALASRPDASARTCKARRRLSCATSARPLSSACARTLSAARAR